MYVYILYVVVYIEKTEYNLRELQGTNTNVIPMIETAKRIKGLSNKMKQIIKQS